MNSENKIATLDNIPDLRGNIEGLKKHSFMQLFVPDSSSPEDIKLRSWLLHTVTSASRHYTKARNLVKQQDDANQVRDGGVIFYIFDVSEEIEACVTATYRACMAIQRLNPNSKTKEFLESHQNSIQELRAIRNQFDHMHSQITSANTGKGPISISFGNSGKSIEFRKLTMQTVCLSNLIDGTYEVVASLYPGFNANSTKELGGPMKLSMSISVTTIDSEGCETKHG